RQRQRGERIRAGRGKAEAQSYGGQGERQGQLSFDRRARRFRRDGAKTQSRRAQGEHKGWGLGDRRRLGRWNASKAKAQGAKTPTNDDYPGARIEFADQWVTATARILTRASPSCP